MFTITQYLPVLNADVRYCELLNKHMLIINKFITNSDDIGLADYFEELIQELLIDKTVYTKMYNVDKFLMLLNLRSICIGDELKFNQSVGTVTVSVRLINIINNYTTPISNFTQSLSINNMYNLILNMPKTLYLSGFDSIMLQVIDKIVDDSTTYHADTINFKNEILKILPANQTHKIIEYINTMSEQGELLHILKKVERAGIDSLSMNPYNNNMFLFIKNIFSEKLYSLYQFYFKMVNSLKFDSFSVNNQTPAESSMYISLFNEQMKTQNSENSNVPEIPPQL